MYKKRKREVMVMKILYVVGYYEEPERVCTTCAEAEEYILAWVEEAAYEDYLYDGENKKSYAQNLYYHSSGMWIQAVEMY